MVDVALMIQGKDAPASDGGTFERLNPMTGEVATRAAAATLADAASAVAAAAAAFPAWSALGPGERRARLNRAADLLQKRTPPILSMRWRKKSAPPPAGRISTFILPPACCTRRRR